jgi:uroporphyrinogen-III decarboxylase
MKNQKSLMKYNEIVYQNKNGFSIAQWSDSLFISQYYNYKLRDYIWDKELKLFLQKKIIEDFRNIIWLPGIWPCFHALDIPSIFGVTLKYAGDNNNFKYETGIKKIEEIKSINKKKLDYSLIKKIKDEYIFFHKETKKRIKEEYHYLNGVAFTAGPLESAAIILGHENFLINLHLNIKAILKLLEIISEEIVNWLREQERINGELKMIFITDHIPSLISQDMFSKLFIKFFSIIFSEFKKTDIFYHNEGYVNHILKDLSKLKIKIFNCGDIDLTEACSILRNTIFMGNLDCNFIKNSNCTVIKEELERLMEIASKNKILISTAGGIHSDMPIEKIDFITNYIYKRIT